MTYLHIVLLMFFVVLCLFLISAVLLQNSKGGGMAGLGGGASDSAFGAHTANVLQKFTGVCVVLFFVLVIVLAKTMNHDGDEKTDLWEGYKAPVETVEEARPEVVDEKTDAPETVKEKIEVPETSVKSTLPTGETQNP